MSELNKLTRRALLAGAAAAMGCSAQSEPRKSHVLGASLASKEAPAAAVAPVFFVGHGSPMHALDGSRYQPLWAAMGAAAGRPSAVVCVSAHWYVPNLSVLSAEFPRTIHDFGGFPEALYALRYPAPGSPEVARRAQALLAEFGGALSDQWGLDHGAWCVLRHIWPDAAVPVVQVSVQRGASAAKHWEFGQRLSALRHEGVVVMGSGNAVHNLRHAFGNMTNPTPQWAAQFDADVASALEQRDRAWLVRALDTDAGRLAHPSADHYLPLLVAAGAAATDPSLSFPVADFDASSISMRSVRWG